MLLYLFSYFYLRLLLEKLSTLKSYEVKDLLALLSQDNEAAFTELYHRFWKTLLAVAYNRLKDSASAEDIVHDVFASLWANRHKVSIDQLENYLAVAVKYGVMRQMKKKIREKDWRQQFHPLVPAEAPQEAVLQEKQLLERIKREVEKLPERCRLIFTCSRYGGMPVKEIARDLQLSPKTVENQLSKAIRQIRLATNSLLHFALVFLFIH